MHSFLPFLPLLLKKNLNIQGLVKSIYICELKKKRCSERCIWILYWLMQKSSGSDQFELSNLCGRLRLRNTYSLKSTYGSHSLFHCPQDSTILLRLSFLSTGFYVIRIKNFLHKWILSQMSVSTLPHSFQKCRECYSFILSHNEMVWWENTGSEFNRILCECISGVYFTRSHPLYPSWAFTGL